MGARIDNWFSYHAPVGDQAERYARLREAGAAFARAIEVREAVMTANAAIACKGQ